MFWTAFTWGIGVSCGASLGLLVFMFLKAGGDWLLGNSQEVTNVNEKIVAFNRESLDRLTERNELTTLMTLHVERIGDAITELVDKEKG